MASCSIARYQHFLGSLLPDEINVQDVFAKSLYSHHPRCEQSKLFQSLLVMNSSGVWPFRRGRQEGCKVLTNSEKCVHLFRVLEQCGCRHRMGKIVQCSPICAGISSAEPAILIIGRVTLLAPGHAAQLKRACTHEWLVRSSFFPSENPGPPSSLPPPFRKASRVTETLGQSVEVQPTRDGACSALHTFLNRL